MIFFYLNFIFSISSSKRFITNLDENIIINNCFFNRENEYIGNDNNLHSSTIDNNCYCGGIIYVYEKNIFLDISNTIFFNCMAKGAGGAIYYSSTLTNSNIKLFKICAYMCASRISYGQFAWLITKNLLNNNITIDLISYLKCSNDLSNYCSPLRIERGNQSIYNINSSLNKVNYYSIIEIVFPNKLLLKFYNAFNNSASINSCLLLWGNSNNNLYYINIIQNSSPGSGIVHTYSNDNYC